MNDAQLLERLHRADAYASETAIPDAIWTADLALREIERRLGMTDQTIDTTDPAASRGGSLPPMQPLRDNEPNRRRWVIGLAAAAVVLVVGLLAALLPSGGEPAASPPPTTVAETTTTEATTVPPTTLDPATAALAAADAFFAAFNAGDFDATLATFAEDADFTWAFRFGPVETRSREQQWQYFAWYIGQGTIYAPQSCQVTSVGEPVALLCETAIFDAAGQVADLGGVPTEATITVADGLITTYDELYNGQDFTRARGRFNTWMNTNHPDTLTEIDFFGWGDLAEARTDGEELASYTALWATHLAENGCENTMLPCP